MFPKNVIIKCGDIGTGYTRLTHDSTPLMAKTFIVVQGPI